MSKKVEFKTVELIFVLLAPTHFRTQTVGSWLFGSGSWVRSKLIWIRNTARNSTILRSRSVLVWKFLLIWTTGGLNKIVFCFKIVRIHFMKQTKKESTIYIYRLCKKRNLFNFMYVLVRVFIIFSIFKLLIKTFALSRCFKTLYSPLRKRCFKTFPPALKGWCDFWDKNCNAVPNCFVTTISKFHVQALRRASEN